MEAQVEKAFTQVLQDLTREIHISYRRYGEVFLYSV